MKGEMKSDTMKADGMKKSERKMKSDGMQDSKKSDDMMKKK